MCRSKDERPPDGRRCPCAGEHYSNGRANRAARKQLSRMRRRLEADPNAVNRSGKRIADQLAEAERRVEESIPPEARRASGAAVVSKQPVSGAAEVGAIDKSDPESTRTEQVDPVTQPDLHIREVYLDLLGDRDGDPYDEGWVSIADLRDHLSRDLDRATVDRVLDQMVEDPT